MPVELLLGLRLDASLPVADADAVCVALKGALGVVVALHVANDVGTAVGVAVAVAVADALAVALPVATGLTVAPVPDPLPPPLRMSMMVETRGSFRLALDGAGLLQSTHPCTGAPSSAKAAAASAPVSPNRMRVGFDGVSLHSLRAFFRLVALPHHQVR